MQATDWGDKLDVRYLVPSLLKKFRFHIDVGCGVGYFLTSNSIGIDIDPVKLKQGTGALIVADGKHLPLRESTPDSIGLLANVLFNDFNDNPDDLKSFVSELEKVTPNILIVDVNPLCKFYVRQISKTITFSFLAKRGYVLRGYGPIQLAFLRRLPLPLLNLLRQFLITRRISANCKMWLAYRGRISL